MPILVQKSIYDPKSMSDGYRVLVMQYWPRGVKKQKIDVWYKELGSSKELIKAWKAGKVTWSQFKARYITDLKEERRHTLVRELAERAKNDRVTLLCGCRDPNSCHRTILKEQIEKVQ